MEHISLNQENQGKDTENKKVEAEKNAQPSKLYPIEVERLALLFFETLKPFELLKYSELGERVPSDLNERFFNAIYRSKESFLLFLSQLEVSDRITLLNHSLKLLANKIDSMAGGVDGTAFKSPYVKYYHFLFEQKKLIKVESKFHLTWQKHNKYFVPLIIQALCDKDIIPEPKEQVFLAFQSIFPDEKLNGENVRGSIQSAFGAKDSARFKKSLKRLMGDIEDSILKRLLEYRVENNLKIDEDQ